MNIDNHIAPEEMQRLLFENSDEPAAEFYGHLQDCPECQRALDETAAAPELWQKVSDFIDPSDFSSDVRLSHTLSLDSNSNASSNSASQGDLAWDSPIDQMLDSPKHPEMMGRIGDYDVECEIGRGGMGVVLKAFDSNLNRPVAIKILAPYLAANGAARERFAREARAAASVFHPNVIAIHGVTNTQKTPYIVMPYIAGSSLQKYVDDIAPLELKDMTRIARQIASGLSAAHSQGVIHRDVKPANILIEQGVSRVVITDFGLARAECDASMTRTGWLAGTPNFMSPEQAYGRQVDGRSDLFCLGSIMYFMATGRLPFRANSPMAVLNRICNEQPSPIREVNSDVSKTFADITEKLLTKDPDDRFQTAGQLHEVLEQYLVYLHQPSSNRPPVIQGSSKDSTNQSWAKIGAAIAVSLLSLIGLLGVSQEWFRATTLEEQNTAVKRIADSPDNKPSPEVYLSAAEFEAEMSRLEQDLNDWEQEFRESSPDTFQPNN